VTPPLAVAALFTTCDRPRDCPQESARSGIPGGRWDARYRPRNGRGPRPQPGTSPGSSGRTVMAEERAANIATPPPGTMPCPSHGTLLSAAGLPGAANSVPLPPGRHTISTRSPYRPHDPRSVQSCWCGGSRGEVLATGMRLRLQGTLSRFPDMQGPQLGALRSTRGRSIPSCPAPLAARARPLCPARRARGAEMLGHPASYGAVIGIAP
jgi:hypothetical protein